MKTLLKLITTLSIACITMVAKAQSSAVQDLERELDETIPNALEMQKVPGLAIAIIKNNKLIVKKGYGYAHVDKGIKVSSETGFNIGSISKLFTSWGIMALVEKGQLDLDAPVSNYIKTWTLPMSSFKADKVTTRNLLQHTAGLSIHGYSGYESKSQLSSTVGSLTGASSADEAVKLILEPGTTWKYSGGGYTVLQLLIEELSGQSFAAYMTSTIFEPLGMTHTSFDITTDLLKASATPYDEQGHEIPLRLFNAQAAAGLHTTLEDLIVFAKASFTNNEVLSQDSIELLRTPTALSGGNYGMGYMIMNRFGNFSLSGHGGSNEGWESGFMLDFNSKSGVIILTNSSSGKPVLFGGLKTWAQWHGAH